jgi:hypothetical protein
LQDTKRRKEGKGRAYLLDCRSGAGGREAKKRPPEIPSFLGGGGRGIAWQGRRWWCVRLVLWHRIYLIVWAWADGRLGRDVDSAKTASGRSTRLEYLHRKTETKPTSHLCTIEWNEGK